MLCHYNFSFLPELNVAFERQTKQQSGTPCMLVSWQRKDCHGEDNLKTCQGKWILKIGT